MEWNRDTVEWNGDLDMDRMESRPDMGEWNEDTVEHNEILTVSILC